MDKNKFLYIDRIYTFSQKLDMDNVELLLREFMKEKDIEKYNSIKQYIPSILSHPIFRVNANMYINVAIDYFERKFDLNRLYDKNNRVVLIY